MTFQELGLHESILKALIELGYVIPTPVQSKAIPKVMQGFDIQASAQTGTGKTAAFLLPALNRLIMPSKIKNCIGPRILVLVPTRELAMQVAAEAVKFSKYVSKARTVCVFGGAPYPPQNRDLSKPYDILVATPGRLIDHIDRGRINFSRLEMFVLDEADRMLDMGFIEPVEKIAALLPKERQTLLFSATLKGSVLKLSQRLLNNPMELSVAPPKTSHENIEQRLYHTDNLDHKYTLLDHLLNDPELQKAIVFTATKRHADELVDKLFDNGHRAGALHGDMNQGQRTRTIAQLRSGQIRILVATDVAARGLDVDAITHVINFDLPMNVEDYVHRIGRTGRADAKGIAMSFVSYKEVSFVKRLESFIGTAITSHTVEGMEPKGRVHNKPRYPKKRPCRRY